MFQGLGNKTQGVIDEDYRRDYEKSLESTEDNNGKDTGCKISINIKNGDCRMDYNESVKEKEDNEDNDNPDYKICINVKMAISIM